MQTEFVFCSKLKGGGGMSEIRDDAGRESRFWCPSNYFDPDAPIGFLSGDLPHWRQDGVTYFVTFRLADSLPAEKLNQWRRERKQWMEAHPEPHGDEDRREYYKMFPHRLQQWLDLGSGSCILARQDMRSVCESALQYFDGQRYRLGEFTVAANHVHVLVSPLGNHRLSSIIHSWKSYTGHEIAKILRLQRVSRVPPLTLPNPDGSFEARIWQKESFDHIVRNPASHERFEAYIRAHVKVAAASRR